MNSDAFKEQKGKLLIGEDFWYVEFSYKDRVLSVLIGTGNIEGRYPISVDAYKDDKEYFWFYNRPSYRESLEKLKSGLLPKDDGSLHDFIEDAINSEDIKSYRSYMTIDEIKEMFRHSGIDVDSYMKKCRTYREGQI